MCHGGCEKCFHITKNTSVVFFQVDKDGVSFSTIYVFFATHFAEHIHSARSDILKRFKIVYFDRCHAFSSHSVLVRLTSCVAVVLMTNVVKSADGM